MIVVFLSVGVLTGYLIPRDNQAQYDTLLSDFQELNEEYNELLNNYNIVSGSYNDAIDEYNELMMDYNNLEGDYDDLYDLYEELLSLFSILQQYYIGVTEVISQMVLPAQYMVFAEAVRRYYFEDYYLQDTWNTGNVSGYLAEFTRFTRDIVLHDSQIDTSLVGSWFPEVSEAFSDCLKYGNQTEILALDTFYNVYCDWLPYWGATSSGNELDDINTIVQWCIDEIDYEFDIDIVVGQESPLWDYVKFPVETAFRTLGDCEDQAMLCVAYLESMGYETTLAAFHDAENPEIENGFNLRNLLVHIEDIEAFQSIYPTCHLWSLGGYDPYEGYTWCWLDTTWDVSFGSEPGWMQYYLDNGLTYEDVTFAVCDLDGAICL